MSAVTAFPGSTCGPTKRQRTSSSDEEEFLKRPRYYYLLAPESSDADCTDGTESVYSCQGYSTGLAKDTSDTSSDTYSDGELEVASSPTEEEQIYPLSACDFSSPSDIVGHELLSVVFSESESCDVSSGNFSSEKDCRRRLHVFTNCVRCKAKNEVPYFRYCQKCYKVKKNFFPPRPKGRKKSRGKSSLMRQNSEVDRDSAVASGTSGSRMSENISESTLVRSGSLSPRLEGNQDDLSEKNDLCSTCLLQPKDGGFLHKKIIHIFSCYECSVKIIKRIGRCPVCNLKVSQVFKLVRV